MKKDNINSYIDSTFKNVSIKLEKKTIDKITKYINFLIKENQKYNLTAITDPFDIVNLHFLDSASLFLKTKIKGKVLDVGTGAGFPGFVFKLLNPQIDLTLLEASLKKVNFLKMLQVELDIYDNIKIIHGRAEDFGQQKDYRFKYDFVTSRAVAPLDILLEYSAGFCKKNGKIYLYKGPNYDEELNDSNKAIELLNLKLVKVHKLDLLQIEGSRYILEFSRIGELNDKYPRRPGIPKKRPL